MNRRLFLATGIAVTTCLCSDVLGQTGNFRQAAEAINATIRANHFHRAELDSDAYRQIEKDVIALGERATSAEEFIEGFNALWRKGPFSHVSLRKAQESAAERYARFDTEMAGPDAVTLYVARQRRHPHRQYHERCRHHRGHQRCLRPDRLAQGREADHRPATQ